MYSWSARYLRARVQHSLMFSLLCLIQLSVSTSDLLDVCQFVLNVMNNSAEIQDQSCLERQVFDTY